MFDVTAMVRAAQTGDGKLSLRLNSAVDDDNSQITFASSENSNALFRPPLVIRPSNAVSPPADSIVRSGANANLNFGTLPDLAVKKDSSGTSDNNRESYLKWDLSGVATAPAGATIRLMPVALNATAQQTADFV